MSLILRFVLSPIGLRIVGAIAVLAAMAFIVYRIYDSGREDEKVNRVKRDMEAISEAEKARRGVDDCYADPEWVWDRNSGRCVRSVPRQPAGG